MTFSCSSHCKRLTILVLTLTSSALCSACSDDATTPYYLGVVDGGSSITDASVEQDSSIPTPKSLTATNCKTEAIAGPDVASTIKAIAAANNRLVLTVSNGVRALMIGADGCPTGPVSGFGTDGLVQVDALAAAPLPSAGRTLVATQSGLQILDSTGKNPTDCTGSAAARLLAIRAHDSATKVSKAGSGYGVLAASSLETVSTEAGSSCSTAALKLQSSVQLVAAIAPAADDGFVLAEQETASSGLVVSRYDSTGARLLSSAKGTEESNPAHLCSVSGMVDTAAGIVVTDATCKRVVLFDDTLTPIGSLQLDTTPRGVVALDDASKVLVAVTSPTSTGAQGMFITVSLSVNSPDQ